MKILLIHQYAGNKGDRAVAFAMCRMLKRINPSVEITISTTSPQLWEHDVYFQQNGISFIPCSWDFSEGCSHWYWSILRRFHKYTFTIQRNIYMLLGRSLFAQFFINPVFLHHLRSANKVISVGGHHFTTILARDIVSSINYDAMAVLTQSKKLICFSQTFGPFHFFNKKNLYLTKKILSSCSQLYIRESNSIKELNKLGITKDKIKSTYESVLTLHSLIKEYTIPSMRAKRIGISIYATQKRSVKAHSAYVSTFARICDHLISQGYEICFFPMEIKGTEPDDRPLIREIISSIKSETSYFMQDEDTPTEVHLQEVSKCRIFIGHKTHSCIFALVTGTPLVGLAYHAKTRDFMQQFECDEFCINDEDFTLNNIITIINSIEDNINHIGIHLFSKSQEYCNKIESNLKDALMI